MRTVTKEKATPPEPTHAFERLTWKQAEALLGKNEANRAIRDRKVQQYQRDMLNGDWDLCAAPIVIDSNGKLIDGQHRLTAQVAAQKTVKWLVMRNVNPDLQKVIDTGMQRSASDVLHFAGEANTTILGGVLRMAYRIKHDVMSGRRAMNISNNELIATLEEEPVLRYCVEQGIKASKGMTHISPTVLATAHWLIMRANDEAEATSFLTRIATLTSEREGSPVLALHKRVTELQRQQIRVRPRDYLALIMKAWNYDASGTRVNKLALYSRTGEYVLPDAEERKMNIFLMESADEREQDEVVADDEVTE